MTQKKVKYCLESTDRIDIFCDIQFPISCPFTVGYKMHIACSYVYMPSTIYFHEGLEVGKVFFPIEESFVEYQIDKVYYDTKMNDWVIKAHRKEH